jgi:hypothetical protein
VGSFTSWLLLYLQDALDRRLVGLPVCLADKKSLMVVIIKWSIDNETINLQSIDASNNMSCLNTVLVSNM